MTKKKKSNTGDVMAEIVTQQREAISSEALFKKITEHAKENRLRSRSINFQHLDIADVTFSNKILSHSNFNFSRLNNVIFEYCTLTYATFQMAELNNVTFIGCSAERLDCQFASFSDVKFVEMILKRSSFDFAKGALSFNTCQLNRSEFSSVDLAITFNRCNCKYIDISSCLKLELNATGVNFDHGIMSDSTITGTLTKCNCNYLNLQGSNCAEADFNDCNLNHVDLKKVVGLNLDDFTYDIEDSYLDELFKE